MYTMDEIDDAVERSRVKIEAYLTRWLPDDYLKDNSVEDLTMDILDIVSAEVFDNE